MEKPNPVENKNIAFKWVIQYGNGLVDRMKMATEDIRGLR